MSVYNDYMVKVSVYFVWLAETYCNLLSQGIDDCHMKNKLTVLAMYLETIPKVGNENCLTNSQLIAICNHINDICGHPDWGTISSINIINPPVSIAPSSQSEVEDTQAWSTTIGTAPITITFNKPLGTSGSDYAITYIATSSGGDSVFVKSITSRTANGFVVDAYEDNVHFEGSATLIT